MAQIDADRALIQTMIEKNGHMTVPEMIKATGWEYSRLNRTLNSRLTTGSKPIGRMPNPNYKGCVMEAGRWWQPHWVYFVIDKANPLTHQFLKYKMKGIVTRVEKVRDNIVDPAFKAAVVATGTNDDLPTALDQINAAITALRAAYSAGDVKAEKAKVAASTVALAAKEAAVKAAEAAVAAEREALEKEKAEVAAKAKALTTVKTRGTGPKK